MTDHVVGLDLSLTSTGVATIDPEGVVVLDRWRPNATGHPRLDWLGDQVAHVIAGARLVVMEGPAYGSAKLASASGQHERAGLWWLVAHQVWRAGIPMAVVPPNVRAMYGAGKGNAGKDEVLAAVIRRHPALPIRGNDQADALILAAMGVRHLGRPLEEFLPQENLRAMERTSWPEATGPLRGLAS